MSNQRFDTSTHFDDRLREVANAPEDMRRAIEFFIEWFATMHDRQKLETAGLIGVFARILGDYELAHQYLAIALELSDQLNSARSRIANEIRLATLYQWQGDFATSTRMFEVIIAACETNPDLSHLVDIAYHHAGKNRLAQGQYASAVVWFELALHLRQAKGNAEQIEESRLALEMTKRKL